MRPVRTPSTTTGFGAPPGREDEVGMLPLEIVDQDGTKVLYSTWELEPHEREAIADGANVKLGVWWIGAMPPVSLAVTSASRENGGILE